MARAARPHRRRSGRLDALGPSGRCAPPRRRRLSVQAVLLALGGGLVAIAALVFTVVSWGHLGIPGRTAVLAAVTVLALTAQLRLRGRPAATAGTAAAVGLALVVLDCCAARAAGLTGLDRVHPDAYATAATVVGAAGPDSGYRPVLWACLPLVSLATLAVFAGCQRQLPYAARVMAAVLAGVALVVALGAAWADVHCPRPPLLPGLAALAVTLVGARHRLRALLLLFVGATYERRLTEGRRLRDRLRHLT